ncbi:MAG: glycosyltransferase family 39 protein [Myxococcales bacterium]
MTQEEDTPPAAEPVTPGSQDQPPAAERAAAPLPAPPAKAERPWLGVALFLGGALATFFIMSQDRHIAFGPLWGTLTTLVAAAGVLELCDLLRARPGDDPLASRLFAPLPGEPLWMAPRVTFPLAVAIVVLGGLIGGADGLPLPLLLALLALFVSGLRRPSLFVFVAASLLLLPMLGSFGLWDPWETHYGEVAREILARDDWITLWWAQDEWFRSKPVLIFWMEALAWGALGMPFGADANPGHPEWAIRLPHYVLTMGALMACYWAMARIFGKRTAVFASLVLATTPYFFLMAHQAITDMPFVATMTIALALFLVAVEEAPEQEVQRYRIGKLACSGQGLVLLALVMLALPQALYLISRNVTFLVDDGLFSVHVDRFMFGSAGNSEIPGNPAIRSRMPYLPELWYQPLAQGVLWLVGLCELIWMLRKERRTQQLAMFGFYLFCSLAWMAKGIPGFALPGIIAAFYLFATARWSLLLSGRLRIGAGILTIAVTGLPWYVAMYGRLGPFFTDRLLIHDHINRLASGVHGDTGSIEYFLAQLGYGAFPWIGLFPLGFVAFLNLLPPGDEAHERKRRSAILLALWASAAFVLFNAMITKFHHYIFPAVPPFALLIGVFLDRALGRNGELRREWGAVALTLAGTLALVLAGGSIYGDVRGVIPENVTGAARATWIADHGLSNTLVAVLVGVGIALLWAARKVLGPSETTPAVNTQDTATASSSERAVFGLALLGAAVLVAFAGRDLGWMLTERPLGHEKLIQLFIYNYGRPFPDYLDYRPIITGFALTFFVLLLVASYHQLRKVALYGVLTTAFWFSAWALNVYMIDLTPHWGQRELVKRYYEERAGSQEPLIAWQMNWKGENLYTGNRVHVFVQLDNKAVTKWMEKHPGTRAYFVLEHSRLGNFKRMMGSKRHVEELSTARENNKFILVRADI